MLKTTTIVLTEAEIIRMLEENYPGFKVTHTHQYFTLEKKENEDTREHFRIKDEVKILPWDELKEEFGLDQNGNIDCCGLSLNKKLKKYCGESFLIVNVTESHVELKQLNDANIMVPKAVIMLL